MREGVGLTNLDQELFDGAGASKRDLVDYLDAVGERMIRQLRDRPLSVMRVLRGQAPFMQKNVPKYTPDWVTTVPLWAEASKRQISYALCNDRRTLLWFANQRAVEYHPTLFRVDQWDRPTHLVLDIDPPDADAFRLAVGAARLVHQALADAGFGERGQDQRRQGSAHLRAGYVRDDRGSGRRDSGPRCARRAPRSHARHYCVRSRGPCRKGVPRFDARRRCHGGGGIQPAAARRSAGLISVGLGRTRRRQPGDFTLHTAGSLLSGRDRWADLMPEPQQLSAELVEEGRAIPIARVQAMHEGKRRARARRQTDGTDNDAG